MPVQVVVLPVAMRLAWKGEKEIELTIALCPFTKPQSGST